MTPREKLAAYIAQKDAERGRPLTAAEQLANLKWALSHCDKCEAVIEANWTYCPWCGHQLMDVDHTVEG